MVNHTTPPEASHPPADDCFRDIFASLPNVSSWPVAVPISIHVAVDLPAQEMTIMATDHELRFNHLFHAGRTFVFPSDAKGRVDLDSLSTSARNNYFFAAR